jgi:hypothetical protein
MQRCLCRDRRLSGVEQNFSGRYSRKGKCEKPSISLFAKIAARHEESCDCQTESLDATPAQHNPGGSAHFSDSRRAVLNWVSSTKLVGARLPLFFLPDIRLVPQNFVSLPYGRQSGRFLPPGIPPMPAGPPIRGRGAELLRTLLPEGKVRKSQVFRYFLRSQPATKRVVTAKPSRWTPRQRSTITAAQHTNPGRTYWLSS